jgi:L-lysine exporter family protein LysE/ArgO
VRGEWSINSFANVGTVLALITGLFTGLSLIIAIGAQNAFVIRQGLTKHHVLLVVAICAASDALLIVLGVGGLGQLIQRHHIVLTVIKWFGVIYLTWFGVRSLLSIFKDQTLIADTESRSSVTQIIGRTLGFTFLNPHVYLDTVIFLGGIGGQFKAQKWSFALGASIASVLWFTSIGFGAKAAARFMSKAIFWKVLDGMIALVMFTLALLLTFHTFN